MISTIIESIRPRSMSEVIPPDAFKALVEMGEGWTWPAYTYYYALGKHFKPKLFFEIGVLGGASMASVLLGAGSDCVAIGWDTECYIPNSNTLAMKALNLCGIADKAFLININSCVKSAKDFPPDVDMIHIDGEHGFDGALHDLNMAVERNIPVILFDDVLSVATGCPEAAKEFNRIHKNRIEWCETLPTGTGLMVVKLSK